MSFAELTILDFVLAPALPLLAAVLLNIRDQFAAIVLFIVFGLLMAVTWARLDAVDIALAEAAIGAGITGALLLASFGELTRGAEPASGDELAALALGRRRTVAAILIAPIVLGLGHAVLAAPVALDRLGPLAAAGLAASGSEHEVTAVLLAYRAYDTLLELAVLLLAVVGIGSLHLRELPPQPPQTLVLEAAERVLIPTTVLLGGYLVWHGSHAPGGAFQGGAVIAGALVLISLGARARRPSPGARTTRLGLVVGVLGFAAVGLAALPFDRPFLYYRGIWATRATLLVEVVATISIATALLAIFIGRAKFEGQEDR